MQYIYLLLTFPMIMLANDLNSPELIEGFSYNHLLIVMSIILVVFIIRHYELKKVNKQLLGSIQDIEAIMNSTVEGIIISEDTKCIQMNDAARALLQIGKDESVKGMSPLHFIAEDSRSKVVENFKKDEVELYEINIQKRDGTISPALVKGKKITFLNKNVRVSLIVDMSEIKRKELQLLQQSKLAALGEMIGNIAHQWRQPLSVVSTSATGMKLQKEHGILSDEQFYNYCDMINENTQYLSQTIDDFRNFIKGDTKPVRFNLKNDTDSFIKLVDGTIKRYNIQVILELHENINIQGYPNELIQCFINIFNNSKDALVQNVDEDERFVFISEFNTDTQVTIVFKDNAGGIPDSILSKIFEPYFTTKTQSQGTGLGLHMSYNLIVNGMNGNIVATNEVYEFKGKSYKGAQFTITIPVD